LAEKGLLFQDIVEGLSDSQIDELISTDEWLDMLGVKPRAETKPRAHPESMASLSLSEIQERLYQVTPARFEELVKELMQHWGYHNVKVTGKTGDGGIDVISTRNTSEGVRRAIAQCKRYKGTVGVEVARALRGVMASDTSIEKGFLVTTGEFSRECLSFCERSAVIATISGLQMANYIKVFGIAV
jgi:restriction system protein